MRERRGARKGANTLCAMGYIDSRNLARAEGFAASLAPLTLFSILASQSDESWQCSRGARHPLDADRVSKLAWIILPCCAPNAPSSPWLAEHRNEAGAENLGQPRRLAPLILRRYERRWACPAQLKPDSSERIIGDGPNDPLIENRQVPSGSEKSAHLMRDQRPREGVGQHVLGRSPKNELPQP